MQNFVYDGALTEYETSIFYFSRYNLCDSDKLISIKYDLLMTPSPQDVVDTFEIKNLKQE